MKYTILLPLNDSESALIYSIFSKKRPDIEIRELDLDWGKRLGAFPEKFNFDGLGQTVVIVEMPDPDFEARVVASGRQLITVDHHAVSLSNGEIQDRRSLKPSIMQLIDMFQIDVTEIQNEIELTAAYDVSSFRGVYLRSNNLGLGDNGAALGEKIHQEELRVRKKFHQDKASKSDLNWHDYEKGNSCHVRKYHTELSGEGRMMHVIQGPEDIIDLAREAYIEHKMKGNADEFSEVEILSVGVKFDQADDTEKSDVPSKANSKDKTDEEPKIITRMFLTVKNNAKSLIDDLVNHCAENADPELYIYSGGDKYYSYFGAESNPSQLANLKNLILSNSLAGNRPLANWQTSFFQPLKIEAKIDTDFIAKAIENGNGNVQLAPADSSARDYLIGSLQERITPTCEQMKSVLRSNSWLQSNSDNNQPVPPIMSFRIKNSKDRAFSVVVARRAKDNDPSGEPWYLEEPIQDVFLHISPDGIAILEWRFGRDAELPFGHDVKNTELRRIKTVAQLQEFNASARMAYEMYKGNYDIFLRDYDLKSGNFKDSKNITPAKLRAAKKDPTGWMGALVDHVLSSCGILKEKYGEGICSYLILDERARFVSSMVPVFDAPSLRSGIAEWELVRARFSEADGHSDEYFYDKKFTRSDLANATYERFETSQQYPGSSSLYQATYHSFSMLGFGWFSENVAINHTREIYARMYLLVLIYEATFQTLWLELAQAAKCHGGDDETAQKSEAIKADISAFSNAFWFKTISTQVQGVELFDLMIKRSRVVQDFQELQNQITSSEEIANAARDRRSDKKRDQFGYLLGFVAIFLAVLEIANYAKVSDLFANMPSFTSMMSLFGIENPIVLEIIIYIFVPFFSFLILKGLFILGKYMMKLFSKRLKRD